MLHKAFMCLGVALLSHALVPSQAQQTAIPIRTCSWYAYDAKVASAGYCMVNPFYYLGISTPPTSFIAKQLTRVYSHSYLCDRLTSNSTCSAQSGALGCYWDDGGKKCRSREMSDWSWFSRHTYLEETPQWLLCPGSQAATVRRCGGLQPAVCSRTPGCTLSKGFSYCTASFLIKLSSNQSDAWFNKYRAMDPAVVGSCESICYLRGLFACTNAMVGASAPKDPAGQQAACNKLKLCRWDNGSCRTRLYGNDAWAAAAEGAGQVCSKLSKDNTTCLTTSPAATIQPTRINQYKNYVQSGASVKC